MVAVELAYSFQPALVDAELVGARHPAGELVPDVDRQPAMAGDHLVERVRGLHHHLGARLVEASRKRLDRPPEARGLPDLLGHESRDLVAPSRERALLALEREPPLARDERPELILDRSAAGDRGESLAEFAQSRGRAHHEPNAGRISVQDPPLRSDARPVWIAEHQQIEHRASADPAAFGRKPGKARRHDQEIAGACGQPGGQGRVAGVDPRAAHPALIESARYLCALDRRPREDELDGQQLVVWHRPDRASQIRAGRHICGPVRRSLIRVAGHQETALEP